MKNTELTEQDGRGLRAMIKVSPMIGCYVCSGKYNCVDSIIAVYVVYNYVFVEYELFSSVPIDHSDA